MTDKKALIERLATTCHGLDAVDPLRLLVDDVVAALREPEQEPDDIASIIACRDMLDAQPVLPRTEQEPDELNIAYMSGLYDGKKKRPWVDLTEQQRNDIEDACEMIIGKPAFDLINAKLKANNT
jgi:hypothetical protein